MNKENMPMLDYNETNETDDSDLERQEIRAELLSRLDGVLEKLLPEGRFQGERFTVGNVQGEPGKSLTVSLDKDNAGLWHDFATGEGGDIFDLIGTCHGLDSRRDFTQVLQLAGEMISHTPVRKPKRRKPAIDELGPATAKYDYFDAGGKLIACVYRYDPPGRKKEFRPYDVATGKFRAPEPRPLFNLSGIATSELVILVEGEKCAQALIDTGHCATTAMHGAKAPVDKTDWSQLANKEVLIWPDNDDPGRHYAEQAGQAALTAGASSVAILMTPPDKPKGWDAADAVTEGFDIQGFLQAGGRVPVHAAATERVSIAGLLLQVLWHTEDGLATVFTQRWQNDWKYCRPWGTWLVWDGRRWQRDRPGFVSDTIRSICNVAARMADKPGLQSRLASSGTIASVARLASTDPGHAKLPEDWDVQPWLLNTPGGMVDLKTGRLGAHHRKNCITKITTATPNGDAPKWRQFLADVTGGDKELQAYLQRMAGYCLTGSTREHALFFLYGTGANGKSVFLNVLTTILGEYARHAPMEMFMANISDRHPTELAMLCGARFVTASETEQGARWNEAKMKEITGGDMVSARFMRKDFFDFIPQFKLVIAGNHRPVVRNIDEAIRRRMHLIPFTVTIVPAKRDHKLTGKLLGERDGILAWAIEGCMAWQKSGLKPPSSVVEATKEYFSEEDALQEFEDSEIVQDPQSQVPIKDIYSCWKRFAESRGLYVGSARWLTEQLTLKGYRRVRLTGGVRGIRGLRLEAKSDDWLPYKDN